VSIRIRLDLADFAPSIQLAGTLPAKSFRIIGHISLSTHTGWTPFMPAIIDTGAPFSLIPKRLWQECKFKIIAEGKVRGIVSRPEAFMGVHFGKVEMVFADTENVSQPLQVMAYLAEEDCQLVIGCGSILEVAVLYVNYKKGEGWLEFP